MKKMTSRFDEILEMDKTGELIFKAGCELQNFDFRRGLDKLIEVDKTGEWLYEASIHWREFDYKKAFKRLLEIDKKGDLIFCAGGDKWDWFDYKQASERLIELDETGELIYYAGVAWKWFDYDKGFEKLLGIDKTGEWIYGAGCHWKKFDYDRALKRLLEIDQSIEYPYEYVFKAGGKWKRFDYINTLEYLCKKIKINEIVFGMVNNNWPITSSRILDIILNELKKETDMQRVLNAVYIIVGDPRIDIEKRLTITTLFLKKGININKGIIELLMNEAEANGVIVKTTNKELVMKFLDLMF